MFGPKHYVPILRWKRAEIVALRMLEETDRSLMTPLVELTPKSFAPRKTKKGKVTIPDPDQVIGEVAEDARDSWGQASFFTDLWHLNPMPRVGGGLHPLVLLAERARYWSLPLIPVTGLRRAADYQRAVMSVSESDRRGACIRLHPADFHNRSFQANLQTFLAQLRLEKNQTDLLIDCQVVNEEVPDFASLTSLIPDIHSWRTLTIAGGAFPRFLTGLTVGQHLLDRLDWMAWLRQLTSRRKLPRNPTYSDYTIQHAEFSEPPERANFSASIRYTLERHWLIMRGEGVFNEDGPGFSQWPANAQLLREHREFRGRDFSYGDRYIFEMGGQSAHPGNAETWLRAGINHHMTFVARQVANLPDL